jgi:alpha-tubulin suppressor-like RCC1 family protein
MVFIRTKAGKLLVSTPKATGWSDPVPYTYPTTLAAMAAADSFCGLGTNGVVSCVEAQGGSPTPGPVSTVPGQPTGTVVEIAAGSGAGWGNGLQCLRLAKTGGGSSLTGNVWCWGDDGGGALGAGAPELLLAPADADLSTVGTVSMLSAAQSSTAVVLTNGKVAFWGVSYGLDGGLHFGTPKPLALPAFGSNNVAVQADDTANAAYLVQGTGDVVYLYQGMAGMGGHHGLADTGFTDFTGAQTWDNFDIGRRAGGTLVVYPWTDDANEVGVFGDGSTMTTQYQPETVPMPAGVTAFAAFMDDYASAPAHVCAIAGANAGVWCWGGNAYGEVGSGMPGDGVTVRTPVQLSLNGGEKVVSVAAGRYFSAAVTQSGKVYAWGANDVGQLGTSFGNSSATPVEVMGLPGPAAGVAAREDFACAWLTDGSVSCWGQNDLGQLGTGDRAVHMAPVPVTGLSNVKYVAVGSQHACALRNDGSVACWGSSYAGEGGTGATGQYPKPQQVTGL